MRVEEFGEGCDLFRVRVVKLTSMSICISGAQNGDELTEVHIVNSNREAVVTSLTASRTITEPLFLFLPLSTSY